MKIFLIDDDPVQHFLISKLITKHNPSIEVQFFFGGESALVQLNADHSNPARLPDVILLDIHMPRFNGWDFLDNFNPMGMQLSKTIKICILTSAIGTDEPAKAIAYPAIHHFFYKPLSLESMEIIDKIALV